MAAACRAPPQQREPSSCSREKAESFPVGTAGHLIACIRSPLIYPSAARASMHTPKEVEQMCPAHFCNHHREVINTMRPTGREVSCLWLRMKAPFCFGQQQLDQSHIPATTLVFQSSPVPRLRQSLTCISAVIAAHPPQSPKGDSHIDSPVVRVSGAVPPYTARLPNLHLGHSVRCQEDLRCIHKPVACYRHLCMQHYLQRAKHIFWSWTQHHHHSFSTALLEDERNAFTLS